MKRENVLHIPASCQTSSSQILDFNSSSFVPEKRQIWSNFFYLSFSAYVVPRRRKQKSENEKIYVYQNYLRNPTAKLASCPKKPFKCPALCCFHTIKVPPRAEQSEKNNDFEKPPSQKCSTMASKLDFYILRNTTFQRYLNYTIHCTFTTCAPIFP